MPRGDGTGPVGLGPMTGRAAGYCAGNVIPGYAGPIAGRGFGMRAYPGCGFGGGGRGWRHWFYATGMPGWARFGAYSAPYGAPVFRQSPDPEMEKQALRTQAEALQSELDLIKKRLADLESAVEGGK